MTDWTASPIFNNLVTLAGVLGVTASELLAGLESGAKLGRQASQSDRLRGGDSARPATAYIAERMHSFYGYNVPADHSLAVWLSAIVAGCPAVMIKPGSKADDAARALADHYSETGEPNQAIEAYQDLRGRIMKSNPDLQNDLLNAAQISRLDSVLATLLRRVGRTD